MISPATIPLRAEFMEDESCCWYACANSITFFARMITPTAPIMASTSVFKLLMGFKTSDTPAAWTGRVYMDAAVAMPARFPVTGSIVYTTVHFSFFDSFSICIPYAVSQNCLTALDCASLNGIVPDPCTVIE